MLLQSKYKISFKYYLYSVTLQSTFSNKNNKKCYMCMKESPIYTNSMQHGNAQLKKCTSVTSYASQIVSKISWAADNLISNTYSSKGDRTAQKPNICNRRHSDQCFSFRTDLSFFPFSFLYHPNAWKIANAF